MSSKHMLLLHGPVKSRGRDSFTHLKFTTKKISIDDSIVDFDCTRNITWLYDAAESLGWSFRYVAWEKDVKLLASIIPMENIFSVTPDLSRVRRGEYGFVDNSDLFHQAITSGLSDVDDSVVVTRLRSDVYISLRWLNDDIYRLHKAGFSNYLILQEIYKSDPKCIADFVMTSRRDLIFKMHSNLLEKSISGVRYSNSIHYDFYHAINRGVSGYEYLCSLSKKTVDSMLWRGCPVSLRENHETAFAYNAVIPIGHDR